MQHTVVFTPEAEAQLVDLYHYIANAASVTIAARYTGRIVSYCESLHTFPNQGMRRDDIRPGLRITNYRKRAVIAFNVDETRINILGIFYGGQNYEVALAASEDESD